MKKSKHKINRSKVRALAEQFKEELDRNLPITVLPNGSISYEDFIVKQTKAGNWSVYNFKHDQHVGEFFLKTCALMAAKAYNEIKLEKLQEIKRLDTQYWANHIYSQVFKYNMKLTKDYERYQILLTRFETSSFKEQHFKQEISKMFKWSFV